MTDPYVADLEDGRPNEHYYRHGDEENIPGKGILKGEWGRLTCFRHFHNPNWYGRSPRPHSTR